ncbi:MAG: hypothetical protein EBY46_01640 [Rhodobacteraceae bacterium]|nr:hypothetical protein [Paracoccaceae bacterium]
MSAMKTAQRVKRDAMFLKGPLTFAWIKRSIPDPTSRLILVAEAFMKMSTPALNSLELSLKVWDCAGIESHDQRFRVLKKIDKRCEGYWVARREGRTAVLHKGKKANETTPE